MARASGDDYWAVIDQRIEQAVDAAIKAERKRNYKVMRQALAEVIARMDQGHAEMLRTMEQHKENAIRVTDELVTRVTALADGGPDGTGIVRKQSITPH